MAQYSGSLVAPRGSRFHSGWLGLGDKLLYTEGVGGSNFVEGNSAGSGSVAKNADHLLAEVSGNALSTAERTWATDTAIDLTNYSTLYVDWENDGDASTNNVSRLVVGEFQAGGSNSFTERLSKTNTFARIEESLDVSALTGSYFIRAHARDDSGTSGNPSSVRVYKLRLES